MAENLLDKLSKEPLDVKPTMKERDTKKANATEIQKPLGSNRELIVEKDVVIKKTESPKAKGVPKNRFEELQDEILANRVMMLE